MSADTPIGRCCAGSRFNAVGGIDGRFWPDQLGTALRQKMRSIAGDRAAAGRVELLPETGVCSRAAASDANNCMRWTGIIGC